MNHVVVFRVCGTRVVVDPAIVQVFAEDTVTFGNDTGGEVKLYLAAGGVLKGVRPMVALAIEEKSGGKGYDVIGEPGVYECAAHYKLKDRKGKVHTGFAVGASSPKIIILPPTHN